MARMIDDNIKRQLSKRMDFFLKYFPVRVRNVGEDAVAARQLIWAFKDARDNAFEKVAQMTAAHLIKVCGEKIKDIVFVCVPASTQAKNESRYMAFCNRVSELCGIINGYSHISVSGDRLAVHEHRHDKEKSITKTQVIEFDEANIKDMGGSETAQQPDKQLNERGGIGRQHVSDGCVTDAVSQCHSVRACPSANGHSSSFGILLPINKECRFDELLVRFRR
jgi:hypothetical protein